MAEDNKVSIDMNAEKVLLGNLLNDSQGGDDDGLKFSPVEELPQAEKYQFMPVQELPESEPFDYQSDGTQTEKTPSVYVEHTVTGINYSLQTNFDSLSDKVSELEDNLGNVSKDMLEAYKTINRVNSSPRPSDNFEERTTVLPTNLIYEDRLERAIEQPIWA